MRKSLSRKSPPWQNIMKRFWIITFHFMVNEFQKAEVKSGMLFGLTIFPFTFKRQNTYFLLFVYIHIQPSSPLTSLQPFALF